ncbi:MAG: YciI family protein [Planctomycetota bacterium]|nr:YciI family protein [Planctomycetota bacterium]
MKYAIIVYESPAEVAKRDDPADAPAYWAAYQAYSQTLVEAGVASGGTGLQPAGIATTIRIRGSERHVHDGPFADTKEQLGGLFVIEVPDLDTALKWAARCPSASTGSVEVRPVLLPPPGVTP